MTEPGPRCWYCGYDLRGNDLTKVCPECGKPWFDPNLAIDPAAVANRRSRWLAAILIIVLLIGCCLGSQLWRVGGP